MDYRAALVEFYKKHNPSKLVDVDALLRKYKGREEELLHALRVKYKAEQPVAEAFSPPPSAPPENEPPQTEPVKTETESFTPETETASSQRDYEPSRVTDYASDYKGSTAAERAEYWKKELEKRERERQERVSEKRTERMKVIKGGKSKVQPREVEHDEEVPEKKPLNIKLMVIIAVAVVFLILAAVVLMNSDVREKLGFGKKEAELVGKEKKEGLEPGVLANAEDSVKKNEGDFSLEEDEPDEKVPSVDDALNGKQETQVKKQVDKSDKQPVQKGVQRGSFYIGCAAVSTESMAKSKAEELRRQGFENAGYFYIPDYDPTGKNFYRIYVGPFASMQDAETMAESVRAAIPDAYCFQLR